MYAKIHAGYIFDIDNSELLPDDLETLRTWPGNDDIHQAIHNAYQDTVVLAQALKMLSKNSHDLGFQLAISQPLSVAPPLFDSDEISDDEEVTESEETCQQDSNIVSENIVCEAAQEILQSASLDDKLECLFEPSTENDGKIVYYLC